MSNLSHTPGPWRRGKVLETRQAYKIPADKLLELMAQEQARIYAGDIRVASCAKQRGQGEAEANARLIAQAPELADQLLWAVRLLRYYGAPDQVDSEEMRETAEEAANVLKAAGVEHE